MHQSSYNIIICLKELVEKNFPQDKIKLLDVGSSGVNGTYKQIFSDSKKYLYTGLDLNPEPNKEGGDDIILCILESQGDGKTFRRSRELRRRGIFQSLPLYNSFFRFLQTKTPHRLSAVR